MKVYEVNGDFILTGSIYVEAESAQEAVDMVRSCQEVEVINITDFNVQDIDDVWVDNEMTEDDWI